MSTAGEPSIDVHDHGVALDEKKRVQCNYCGKSMSCGFLRLKYHLGGVRGDVAACEKVPESVREIFRNMLLGTKSASLLKEVDKLYNPDLPWKRNPSPDLNGVKNLKHDSRQTAGSGSQKHAQMQSMVEDEATQHTPVHNRRVGSKIGESKDDELSMQDFFFEAGIDFSCSTLPSFQKMINATLGDGELKYQVSTFQDLKGWILQDELEEMQKYVKEISHSWESTGCSILLDEWVNRKGRNLVNFLVECPFGSIYLRSTDISGIVHDVNALQLLLDGVIKEVGVGNAVQIVAFSTVGWMGAVGKLFMKRCRGVFWSVSASHCIELMLEKFGAMDSVKGILEKVKLITKFIYGRAEVLKRMRNHTYDYDLIKPSKKKLATPFFTLENIVSEKKNLEDMFESSEWKTLAWASSVEGKRVADLVGDPSFWDEAEMASNATMPLLRVLCLINGDDKPHVGYIYETMDQVKETIKKGLKNKKSHYDPFWMAIDEIWDTHLHSPLHAAGYHLNRYLFYSTDFYGDPEVAFGLLSCVVRMIACQQTQYMITLHLDEYRHARGAFEEGSNIVKKTDVAPAQWWCIYGKECPELQRHAIRILSQTCDGASRYSLKRDMSENLTNGRNHIEQQRLSDLTFVHYNLQLRNKRFGVGGDVVSEEIDLMDDWIMDKAAQEIVPEYVEGRSGIQGGAKQ